MAIHGGRFGVGDAVNRCEGRFLSQGLFEQGVCIDPFIALLSNFIDAIKLGTIFKVKRTRKEKHNMRQIIQKTLIILALGLMASPSEAQTAKRERIRRDRREDVRDRREDVRDRREDVRDRREDVRDARHQGGPLDRVEDRRDQREDVRDRREDVRDRREDRRDRRRRGTFSTAQHPPQPQIQVGYKIGYRQGFHRGPKYRHSVKRHRHHHCRR